MEIIAGNIYTELDGDLDMYLSSNQDRQLLVIGLNRLVSSQFDRLQRLDPAAYQLLCRAGCYRYQELSRVNPDALFCLLWDIEPEQRCQVLDSLKNRSLIEYHRGQYCLHPAIRAESIARLRHTGEWVRSHQQAAQYWTNSIAKIVDITTAKIGRASCRERVLMPV